MKHKFKVTNWVDETEVPEAAKDGSYIHGLFLQGAAWKKGTGFEEGHLTDMVPM